MITGAEAMRLCLEAEGVTKIFGYPGAAIHHFYEELSNSDTIEHILVRQEQNAGHMASGYARTTGKVGVCLATSGPGAANLFTAIATAYNKNLLDTRVCSHRNMCNHIVIDQFVFFSYHHKTI